MDLGGKRVLLSGASGGLGNAIARELADAGAKLVLSGRREKELRELARSLPGGARVHKVIVADLARSGAGEKLVREAGKLDVLVANAALPASGKIDGYTQTELGRAVRVNLEAPIRMTRELLPGFLEKGEGHFVYIASLSGHYASARSALYAATKFGLRGFALGLREDVTAKGVGVSIVSPGFVRDAGMFADTGAKPPPGSGTTTPKKVSRAVVKAIAANRAEIKVAPLRQRAMVRFASRHSELVGRATRGSARAAGIADGVADKQTGKR